MVVSLFVFIYLICYSKVGAGTVGSVLANRLSVNPNISLLLIEAGGQFGALSTIPLLALALQRTPSDWAFVSTSQKHSSRGLYDNVSITLMQSLSWLCKCIMLRFVL